MFGKIGKVAIGMTIFNDWSMHLTKDLHKHIPMAKAPFDLTQVLVPPSMDLVC